MPLIGVDEKGNPITIPFKVMPDTDHRVVYANGALGAVYANYHFRLDFYRDDLPILNFVDVDGTGKVPYDKLKEGVDRKVVVSVILPMPCAKELLVFLDKNLKDYESQYGEVQLPKSNVPEEFVKSLTGQEKTHELETTDSVPAAVGAVEHKPRRSRNS